MKKHLTNQQINDYLIADNSLEADQLQHLEQCQQCQDQVKSFHNELAASKAALNPGRLTQQQIRARFWRQASAAKQTPWFNRPLIGAISCCLLVVVLLAQQRDNNPAQLGTENEIIMATTETPLTTLANSIMPDLEPVESELLSLGAMAQQQDKLTDFEEFLLFINSDTGVES